MKEKHRPCVKSCHVARRNCLALIRLSWWSPFALAAWLGAAACSQSSPDDPRDPGDTSTGGFSPSDGNDVGGAGGEGGIPGFATIDSLPECDPEEPSLDCILQLFLPLDDAEFPFDANAIAPGFVGNAFHVAETWQLSALHVRESESQFPFACFFEEVMWASDVRAPLSGPGCGTYLVAGGHPRAPVCHEEHVLMSDCVDQVPFSETFDFIVSLASEARPPLPLWGEQPAEGDVVFVVGTPHFGWLDAEERERMAALYPLVSAGRVLRLEGRGIIHSALTLPGNSGGAVLNQRGEVIGVTSTLVGHLSRNGTAVPEGIEAHRSVATLVTPELKELITRARELD